MKDFMSYADSLKILKDTINAWEKVEKVAITDALDLCPRREMHSQ